MNYFSFKGVDNVAMGVVLTEPIVVPVPARRGESVMIPGRSGSAWIDGGAYDPVDITLSIWIPPGRERARRAAGWLNGSGWLTDEQDALYGWEARVSGMYSLAALPGPGGHQGIVPMQVQPLRRLLTPYTAEITTYGSVIVNPEAEEAYPILTVYGSGACSIRVNDREVRFASLPGNGTVINSETQEVYLGDTLYNNDMAGEFPVLEAGDNVITWDGDVTSIKLSVRWQKI